MKNLIIFSVLLFASTLFNLSLSQEISGRILNGDPAKKGQFPWHVDIRTVKGGKDVVCGGTLISRPWVLTAAQCLEGAKELDVSIGLTNKDNREFNAKADHFVYHKSFNKNSYSNDVALIHLHSKLPKSEAISFVKLPTADLSRKNFEGYEAVISGFGRYKENDPKMSDDLLWMKVRIVPNEMCQKLYKDVDIKSWNENLCALPVKKDQNICDGDMGGGLIIEDKGQKYLIGVASFTTKSCLGGPAVYKRLTSYLDWTLETILKEDH